jgi:hypothetical protein
MLQSYRSAGAVPKSSHSPLVLTSETPGRPLSAGRKRQPDQGPQQPLPAARDAAFGALDIGDGQRGQAAAGRREKIRPASAGVKSLWNELPEKQLPRAPPMGMTNSAPRLCGSSAYGQLNARRVPGRRTIRARYLSQGMYGMSRCSGMQGHTAQDGGKWCLMVGSSWQLALGISNQDRGACSAWGVHVPYESLDAATDTCAWAAAAWCSEVGLRHGGCSLPVACAAAALAPPCHVIGSAQCCNHEVAAPLEPFHAYRTRPAHGQQALP